MEPFALEPILVAKPWGGRRLAALDKHLPTADSFGESWEVADLTSEVTGGQPAHSRITTGPLAGQTLDRLSPADRGAVYGSESTPAFPLLIKYLDAREHLSIQVHPDAEYAAAHPGAHLKTESWYVVDTEPGASVYIDLKRGASKEDLKPHMGRAELVALLDEVPVAPGNFFHLPAGLIHALGAGVVVAEVQTPSDTTFRLYDWTSEYGRAARPLHLEESLEAITARPADFRAFVSPREAGATRLESNRHYTITELRSGSEPITTVFGPRPAVGIAMVVAGTGRLGSIPLNKGSTAVAPATTATTLSLDAYSTALWIDAGPG